MQQEYRSVSFSSKARTRGTPSQYTMKFDFQIDNVQQLRLGTLELPQLVQPNVDSEHHTLILQEDEGFPKITLEYPVGFYTTQEIVNHTNTRLNVGCTNNQNQSFDYCVWDAANPITVTFDNTANQYRLLRKDVINYMNDKFASMDFTFTLQPDGRYRFDFGDKYNGGITCLDFTSSSDDLVNMLGVDKTRYFQTFTSPHNYYPNYIEYTVTTPTDVTGGYSLTLNEPLSYFTLLYPHLYVSTTNGWTYTTITGIQGNTIMVNDSVTVRQGAPVRVYPELVNMYHFTVHPDLKFQLSLILPYEDYHHVKILGTSTMNNVMGLNDTDIQVDAAGSVVFPNQFNTDSIPYVMMHIKNLENQSSHRHAHIEDNDDISYPLAKIVLHNPFHINRNQIMEMNFPQPIRVSQLDIEFRNPDGTLSVFQGRDHSMTVGFVIQTPQVTMDQKLNTY